MTELDKFEDWWNGKDGFGSASWMECAAQKDAQHRELLNNIADAFDYVLGTGLDARILGNMIRGGVTSLEPHIEAALQHYVCEREND